MKKKNVWGFEGIFSLFILQNINNHFFKLHFQFVFVVGMVLRGNLMRKA